MTILDRFEEEYAVLERDGEMITVLRNRLAENVREGDVLVEKDGIFTADEAATNKRRAAVRSKMRRLIGKK